MSNRTKWIMTLVAMGLALYGHTLSYDFVYDDIWTIVRNPSLDHVFPLQRFFSDASTVALPDSGIPGDAYRPLSTFSFAIQKKMVGLIPAAFRAINIALHILNGVMLFVLLARWVSKEWAFLGAALFLVHPAQVESVVWVTQRSILICCFGVLLSLLSWSDPRENKKKIVLVFLGYGIALLGKETALGLPLLLWATPKPKQKRDILPLLFLLTGGLAYLLLRRSVLGHWSQDIQQLTNLSSSLKDGLAGLFLYGKLILWPAALNVSYRRPEVMGFTVAGLVIFVGWIVTIARTWHRVPGVAWGLSTAFVFWLPHSGLVPLVTFAADRFLYLPMLGLGVTLAFALKAFPAKGIARLVLLGLTFFAAFSFRRTFDWKNEEHIWAASVKTDPDNAFALGCYGYELTRQERDDEAEVLFEQCLAKGPTVSFAKTILPLLISLNQRQNDPDRAAYWQKKYDRAL